MSGWWRRWQQGILGQREYRKGACARVPLLNFKCVFGLPIQMKTRSLENASWLPLAMRDFWVQCIPPALIVFTNLLATRCSGRMCRRPWKRVWPSRSSRNSMMWWASSKAARASSNTKSFGMVPFNRIGLVSFGVRVIYAAQMYQHLCDRKHALIDCVLVTRWHGTTPQI